MSGERLIRPAPPRLSRRKLLIGLGVGARGRAALGLRYGLARGALIFWRRPRL